MPVSIPKFWANTFNQTARAAALTLAVILSATACSSSPLVTTAQTTTTVVPAVVTSPATLLSPVTTTPTINSLPTQTRIPTQQTTPAPPTTPPICQPTSGRIEVLSLESQLLKDPLEYRVYLPPCYDENLRERYPVLYLIHGQSYTDDQWDRLGANETADRLIAAGEIPALIIVMPRDRRWSQPAEDLFGQSVAEELIPHIDRTYRTHPERFYRAVGGLSRGGGWALHLGLFNWQLFSAIGGHSLATFWGDAPFIRTWLDEIPEDSMPRIYLDAGDHDRPPILETSQWFENLLTQRNIPHEWHLFPGYHDEAYWSSHVEDYLRWYTLPWK